MKEEFCSTVSTTESFISPDELQYPLRPPQDLTLFSMSDVAWSVVMTKSCVICSVGSSFVGLEKLLFFEPYNNLGEDILKELFDKKKDWKTKDDFVREADSRDIDQIKEYFLKLFNIQHYSKKGYVEHQKGQHTSWFVFFNFGEIAVQIKASGESLMNTVSSVEETLW